MKKFKSELVMLTQKWNRIVQMPYLVHTPEENMLIMLVNRDYRAHIMRSLDLGRSWTDPADACAVVEQMSDNQTNMGFTMWLGSGLTYLGNGHMFFQTGRKHGFSHDYGQTWPEWRSVPLASNGKHWGEWDPLLVDRDPSSGKVVRLMSFCSDNLQPDGHFQGYIRFSMDMGVTWVDERKVDQWYAVNEVAFLRTKTGRIVAACRTDSPEERLKDIDHWNGLAVSLSDDNGNTWTELEHLYSFGRHCPCLVQLSDGRIIMTYIVRLGYPDTNDGYPQFGIEAIVSTDDGQTWELENRYVLSQWQGNHRGDNSWRLSPQSTSLRVGYSDPAKEYSQSEVEAIISANDGQTWDLSPKKTFPDRPYRFLSQWQGHHGSDNRWRGAPQSTSSVLLPNGAILTTFGTGIRSKPDPAITWGWGPHDVCLVRWRPDPF